MPDVVLSAPLSTDSAVRVVLDALHRKPSPVAGPSIVAVDGPSGAGKTDLAQALSTALADAPVVHLDDLYPGWDGLAASVPLLRDQVLVPLAAGGTARYRRYDWATGRSGAEVEVPRAPVVLVEGAGCGSRAGAAHLTLLVWLDAAPDVRFARGMARDGETYRPHWERWARQEAALFAAEDTASRADVVLRSDPGAPAAAREARWQLV